MPKDVFLASYMQPISNDHESANRGFDMLTNVFFLFLGEVISISEEVDVDSMMVSSVDY